MKKEIEFILFQFWILLKIRLKIVNNFISLYIYIGSKGLSYTFAHHYSVVLAMLVIDIGVTFFYNTLRRVLRWKTKRELYESARHVFCCLIVLGVFLFVTKTGAEYSRATVFLAYGMDYILIFVFRTCLRFAFQRWRKKPEQQSVFLMTTDGFLQEGIERLKERGFDIKYLYLLENNGKKEIDGLPVIGEIKEAASVICWEMIDRIYIYGLDHQMVPEYLVRACKEMGLGFELVDFNYRVIEIKTIRHKDPKFGALTFLEGKRDIPFPIRRVYWITETEAELHRGFHAHKLNCQLLYCPYGCIDIVLDDGEQTTTVTLDRPGKGLILMPGLWREMVWRKSGSVLCVLASEFYDAEEYIRNYDEFIAYSNKYRESA